MRADLERMAREAVGFKDDGRTNCVFEFDGASLARFAASVSAAERDRCANVVETQETNGDYVQGWFDLLAAKIRSLP